MSDTPRTDAAQWGTGKVTTDFTRQLERELNAAKADADSWREQAERFGHQLIDRNDQLNAANERIKRLEEAGDAMMFWCADEVSLEQWNFAKK